MQLIRMDKGETHSDHNEDSTDGTKYGLGWCRARDLLREIHGLDGHVQQRESAVPTSLGIFIHGRKWREERENGVAGRL
jgi:hypothetical protein